MILTDPPPPLQRGQGWRCLLREPLLHFCVLGGMLFWLYSAVHGDAFEARKIDVSAGKRAELAAVFEKTWRRPPSAAELSRLIDGYVQEEALYREARRLGLDRDDVVIRRRLAQKLNFLLEPTVVPAPSEAQLQAYLREHAETFRSEPQLAFTTVFVDIDARGAAATDYAQRLLRRLQTTPGQTRPAGDATLLPGHVALSPSTVINAQFGDDFGHAVAKMPIGEWSGPVRSGYGLHLVKVEQRVTGAIAPLEEIREQVAQAWRDERSAEMKRAAMADLRARYSVSLQADSRENR